MKKVISRRALLSTTIAAGAAAIGGTRAARALSVAPTNAEAQRLYLSACSTKDGTYHKQLVAEVKERLQGKVSEAEIEAAIAQSTCPVCGCPITAS